MTELHVIVKTYSSNISQKRKQMTIFTSCYQAGESLAIIHDGRQPLSFLYLQCVWSLTIQTFEIQSRSASKCYRASRGIDQATQAWQDSKSSQSLGEDLILELDGTEFEDGGGFL